MLSRNRERTLRRLTGAQFAVVAIKDTGSSSGGSSNYLLAWAIYMIFLSVLRWGFRDEDEEDPYHLWYFRLLCALWPFGGSSRGGSFWDSSGGGGDSGGGGSSGGGGAGR